MGRRHLPALLPGLPQLQDQVSDTKYCNSTRLLLGPQKLKDVLLFFCNLMAIPPKIRRGPGVLAANVPRLLGLWDQRGGHRQHGHRRHDLAV